MQTEHDPFFQPNGRLSRSAIDGFVRGTRAPSFSARWAAGGPDCWAVYWTLAQFVIVAAACWWGPASDDAFSRRALAPVSYLSVCIWCLSLIWLESGLKRRVGWALLAFFTVALPLLVVLG